MANEDITKALIRLAVATREHIDAGVIALYEEDTADFPPAVIIEACERLRRTSVWFPKVAELLDACQTIRGEQHRLMTSLARHEPRPMTPEEHARGEAMRDEFLAKLRAVMRTKSMPRGEA